MGAQANEGNETAVTTLQTLSPMIKQIMVLYNKPIATSHFIFRLSLKKITLTYIGPPNFDICLNGLWIECSDSADQTPGGFTSGTWF
jgi:hypothetical protein